MIGTIDPNQRSVTVIGGGIAGLLAAWHLDRAGYEVTLYEAQARLGGVIDTTRLPQGIAESAAHSFLANEDILAICRDLGVELLPLKNRARFILRAGRLRRFPLSIVEALVTAARACFFRAHASDEAQTLEKWAKRHLGEAALRYLIVPFVRGIYGVRPSALSVRAAFPSLVIPPGRSLLGYLFGRPRTKKSAMMAPAQGMGSIIQALEAQLRKSLGSRLRVGSRLEVLPNEGNIVLATPAREAALLLRSGAPELASALDSVRYAPLVSVTCFVKRSSLKRMKDGVGVLVPEAEPRRCLGVLFNSSSFENRVNDGDQASLTMMRGGVSWPEDLSTIVVEELRALLGFDGSDLAMKVHRWERAIPIYDETLVTAWETARTTWCKERGRILFGNYTGQVSLRGMISSARSLALVDRR